MERAEAESTPSEVAARLPAPSELATVTTEKLVTKDFQMEPDADKMRKAAEVIKEAEDEAEEEKERESKKGAAERLLKEWQARTGGDVYAMFNSAKSFTDLFENDPLGGVPVQPGHAAGLKKAWHRLAAKLHPDRQRNNSTAMQVLAEEVFKTLSLAYNKESAKLGI